MKTSYQALRIIACVSASLYFIVEALDIAFESIAWTLLQNVLVSYVPLFFMLSGRFLLDKYEGDLWGFYKRRVIKIGIPFLVASFVALITKIGFSISLGFIKDYIKGVCTGSIEPAYSFMYSLFVFYLVVPFLSVMVKQLREKERRALILVLVGWFVFFDLCVVLNLRLFIVSYPFLNYMTYALVAYLIDHIEIKEKEYKGLLIAGGIGLLVSSAEVVICPDLNWALDSYCLTRALICLGIYLVVTRWKVGNEKLQRCIDLMGKGTYYVSLALPILLGILKR